MCQSPEETSCSQCQEDPLRKFPVWAAAGMPRDLFPPITPSADRRARRWLDLKTHLCIFVLRLVCPATKGKNTGPTDDGERSSGAGETCRRALPCRDLALPDAAERGQKGTEGGTEGAETGSRGGASSAFGLHDPLQPHGPFEGSPEPRQGPWRSHGMDRPLKLPEIQLRSPPFSALGRSGSCH